MYTEITKDKLLQDASWMKNFIIAKGLEKEQLIELGTLIKEKKDGIVDIFWLDGSDPINYPSFASIKMSPIFLLKNGNIVARRDGLIFPQSEPIILIIANFNRLSPEEQENYLGNICKKEDNDYLPHNYLHNDSIVILGIGATDKEPKISSKLDVRSLK